MPEEAVLPAADSIEAVIAESIADIEVPDEGGSEETPEGSVIALEAPTEGQTETREAPEAPVVAAAIPEAPKPADEAAKLAAEDEAFAKEHGVAAKDAKGRVNRIPYTDVKRMIGTAERKLAQSIIGKDLDKAKPVLDQVKAHFQGTVQALSDAHLQLDNVSKSEDMIRNRPEDFIKILPQINPRYAELIGQGAPAAKHEPAAEMPKPDKADGTYSPEALKALLDWNAGSVEKRVLTSLDPLLKPLKDQKSAQEYAAQQIPKLTAIVNTARTQWPEFVANEKAIHDLIRKEPQLGLAGAYARHMGTVLNGLRKDLETERTTNKADREKMRAELLKEIGTTPSSTSTAVGKRVVKEVSEDEETTEDVIAASIKGLKR